MDDKKKAIQTKDEHIQRLERQEMERTEHNMDGKSRLDLSPDYKGGELAVGGDNTNKYKLKDYEEAFRRLYVRY